MVLELFASIARHLRLSKPLLQEATAIGASSELRGADDDYSLALVDFVPYNFQVVEKALDKAPDQPWYEGRLDARSDGTPSPAYQ
jgi:hypothetical protein